MRDLLSKAAATRPDHPFLSHDEQRLSFAEADLWAARMAGGLRERGVGAGVQVALWARNDFASAIAMFAVWRAGGTVLLLNTRLTEVEARAQADAAVVALAVGNGVPDLRVPSVDPEDLDGPGIEGGEVDRSATAWVVFTSGSADHPKGVRLTFGNLEASAAGSARHLRHGPDDRWLAVLPVFHVGGASILVRSAREATTVLLEPGFDPGRAARLLRNGTATLASLVAVTLRRVLDAEPGPYTGVRAVLVGGGPVPGDLCDRAAGAGLPILPTYGMTETSSQVATGRLEDGLAEVRRVVSLPGAEIRTVGGRVQVRGPMVSPGYLDEPDRSPDEWFETGDLGEVDHRGSLTVLGRADDVIVTGGENVHPAEVEAVLRTHPNVTEAVVLGVPDPVFGSSVVAVYEGDAGVGELERYLRYRLAGFKIPRRWVPVGAIPRLSIGKPDRRAMRAMIEGGGTRNSGSARR